MHKEMKRLLVTSGLFFGLVWGASNVSADTTFLLQLGTFSSESQAEDFWDDVKEENQATLSELNQQVRELKLPFADATQYRLQAGPVDDRQQAEGYCAELKLNKVDCFVVETAMYVGDEQPETELAALDAFRAAEDVEEELAASIPDTDSEDIVEVPDMLAITPEIESAAALSASEALEATAPEATVEEASGRSLFSRMTGGIFDAEEEELVETTQEATETTEEELSLAKSEVEDAVTATIPADVQVKMDASLPWLNRDAKRRRVKLDEIEKVVAEADVTQKPAIIVPSEKIKAEAAKKQVTPKVEPRPLAAPSEMAALRATPRVKPVIRRIAPNKEVYLQPIPEVLDAEKSGTVTVAEAIPVEDYEAKKALNVPAAEAAVLPAITSKKPFGLAAKSPLPSMHEGKAGWVKISSFSDGLVARGYWRKLKQTMPEVASGLRMRITQPVNKRFRQSKVAMHLGPFRSEENKQEVCSFFIGEGLDCVTQQKKASGKRAQRQYSYRSTSSVKRHGDNPQTAKRNVQEYWAQLGSYRSRAAAMEAWDEMKADHASVMKNALPRLMSPQSYSGRQVYRLRTGAYATRQAAQQFCNKLRARSVSCLVVTDR